MSEALADTSDGPSDATLLGAVRAGDGRAYGVLYQRHVGAARRAAAALTASAAERNDLIAEAFTQVLRILRSGGGPLETFRPYLFTTMRNTLISWRRRDSPLSLVADVPDACPPGGPDDAMDNQLHAGVAADAFASLPDRWRAVLWRTEIEGQSPAQIGAQLGMTPNSVAALAYRAREGLRRAYLEQYLPTVRQRECRTVVGKLAGWVRHGFPPGKMRSIADHVDHCPDCRELANGLSQLNHGLPNMPPAGRP